MKTQSPWFRLFIGIVCTLLVVTAGFAWVAALIPTWGSMPQEVSLSLPGDEIIPQPQFFWNHAITIRAGAGQVYPWLVQMGDTRAAYYSYTFIENVFMIFGKSSDRYVNADRIHPEWQNPLKGQGMIFNYLVLADTRPGQYVLAISSPEMQGFQWTWLWYLQPVDRDTTRLIVRHRFLFPAEAPEGLISAVLNTGYVMERGMLLGIRDRAEGNIPPVWAQPLGIFLWLAVLACGIAAAVRFVRAPGRYHPLGIGLEAVIVLFIFTFIQPAIWLRIVLLLALAASLAIAYQPGKVSRLVRAQFTNPPSKRASL